MHDTIARRSDVDKGSIKYDVEPGTKAYRLGTVTFSAKKDASFDLRGLHAELNKTRLAKGTKSGVNWFEITVLGDVIVSDKQMLLQSKAEQFRLIEHPKAQPKDTKKTAYQRLHEAVQKGEKITSVTGRLQNWNGVWPEVLSNLSKQAEAKQATVLLVTDFTAK